MKKNQYNNDEYNLFYSTLKDDFKNAKINQPSGTGKVKTHSKIIDLKIDDYFEIIFGERYNSNLFEYYNSLYFEVKDTQERNNKIISKTVNDFHLRFSYFFTEIAESRFFYFISSSFLEKKLGFQKGDEKFNNFLVKLILKNMKFENQNLNLIDDTYGTIINEFINESIKNIRHEIDKNKVEIDVKEILNDINKFEIKKGEGKFEFLNESINSLRVLKADIDSFKIDNSHTIKNTYLAKDSGKIEKNSDKIKIEIFVSPTKFRHLLIKFFENIGITIDVEKKRKIDRFILNVIEFDTVKFNNFKHSAETNSIDFFGNSTNILKFCGLIIFLTQRNYAKKISSIKLQNILRNEININDSKIYISEDLRNQIRNKITSKKKALKDNEIAKFAGFANTTEIITYINN